MQNIKKIISTILILVLIISMVSSTTYAVTEENTTLSLSGTSDLGLLMFLSSNWTNIALLLFMIIIIIVLVIVLIRSLFSSYKLYKHIKKKYEVDEITIALSCAKHVDGHFVFESIKIKKTQEIYYSPSEDTSLIIYPIPDGMKTAVNQYMDKDSTDSGVYDYNDFDLSGFKLLVIVDFKQNTINHAEVRYGLFASKQITHIRHKYKMFLQLLPTYKRNRKYKSGKYKDSEMLSAGNDQLAK